MAGDVDDEGEGDVSAPDPGTADASDDEPDPADDPTPDDDEPTDEDEPTDATREPADGSPRRPPARLDARTIALSALVALIAAVLTGLIVARITDDGEEPRGRATLEPAQDLPDITVERLEGGEVSLSDYRGQPLVVNFWGAWCAPCVEEMPDLQRVHRSLGEDVAFLGVNVRDSPEAARRLAESTGVTYDLVRDTEGDLTRELDVVNFPTTVLVSPDGTVIDHIRRRVSAERLCEKINQSLMAQSLEECG